MVGAGLRFEVDCYGYGYWVVALCTIMLHVGNGGLGAAGCV